MFESSRFFADNFLSTLIESTIPSEVYLVVRAPSVSRDAAYIVAKHAPSGPAAILAMHLEDHSDQHANNTAWFAPGSLGHPVTPSNFGCPLAFREGVLTVICRDSEVVHEVKDTLNHLLQQCVPEVTHLFIESKDDRTVQLRIQVTKPNHLSGLSKKRVPIDKVLRQMAMYSPWEPKLQCLVYEQATHVMWATQRYRQQLRAYQAKQHDQGIFDLTYGQCVGGLLAIAKSAYPEETLRHEMQSKHPVLALSDLVTGHLYDGFTDQQVEGAGQKDFATWCNQEVLAIGRTIDASDAEVYTAVRHLAAHDSLQSIIDKVKWLIERYVAVCPPKAYAAVRPPKSTALWHGIEAMSEPLPHPLASGNDHSYVYDPGSTAAQHQRPVFNISWECVAHASVLAELKNLDEFIEEIKERLVGLTLNITADEIDSTTVNIDISMYVSVEHDNIKERLAAHDESSNRRSAWVSSYFAFWGQSPDLVMKKTRTHQHNSDDLTAKAIHLQCVQSRQNLLTTLSTFRRWAQPVSLLGIGLSYGI